MVYFRQAAENDLQNLKDIAKRVVFKNYVPFLGVDAATAFMEGGMSDKEIDDGFDNCMLMIYDERTIGFVITNDEVLHLVMIDVPFQNRGYGSLLLAKIEEKLFSAFNKIHLQTFQGNVSAVQFYLKNGWLITGLEKVVGLDKVMLQFAKLKNGYSRKISCPL